MTQQSRKALIELLFLALYLDERLSLAEDEVLNDALESLGWDSPLPREKFILSAFAAARAVADAPEKAQEFIIARAEVIESAGEQAVGLTWLSKVLGSDGISPTEKYFLSKLEARFYPK